MTASGDPEAAASQGSTVEHIPLAATAPLDLAAPGPVLQVAPEEAERSISVAADVAARIDAMTISFVDAIASLDPHGEEYRRRVADIRSIGEREIIATSRMSGRLLDRPIRALGGILERNAPIAKNLAELRRLVDDLSPARYDLHRVSPRRRLGVIPAADQLRRYFDRYARAQGHVAAIVRELSGSRDELRADSAAIAQEQRVLWTEMETLRQYTYLARSLDGALERRIDTLAATDPARARTLRADVLFPVRQRLADLLTQLAVAAQGYAALGVVAHNNEEVIRAIQTATTTTTAALRTAVMVAQALSQQRLLVEQLRAVNQAASGVRERATDPARAEAGEARATSGVGEADLAALQRAWNEVFSALDQIDTYTSTALETMLVTVRELTGQVERSRSNAEQLERADTAKALRAEVPPDASMLRIR